MLITAAILILLGESLIIGAPFFGTKKKVLPHIVPALKIRDDSVCYSLGCGNANLLRSIREYSKNAKLVGIEKGILLIVIARILSIGKNIKIKYGSMLKADVHEATHIYLYAGKKVMQRFEEKLFNECKKGTRIISFNFEFPNIKPIEHIILDKNKFAMTNNIYIYEKK